MGTGGPGETHVRPRADGLETDGRDGGGAGGRGGNAREVRMKKDVVAVAVAAAAAVARRGGGCEGTEQAQRKEGREEGECEREEEGSRN